MREYAVKMVHALKSPALSKIWQSSASERGRIILLSLLYSISALISLGFTLVMKELVDAAVNGNRQGVVRYALLLASLIVMTLLNNFIRRILNTKIHTNLLEAMRMEAMHKLLHKRYAALQTYHSGELVNHIFSDVSVVADGVISIVPPLLYLTIQLLGAVILLYRLNTGFMLILLFAGILGAGASFALRHKMKGLHKESQQARDKLLARVQETLENLRIIKASGTEDRMEGETYELQKVFSGAQIRRGRFSALMGTGLGLIFRGSWFYALLWGCSGIYRGAFSYGTLTAILQLVNQIQHPFESLISTMSNVYGAVSSAERLMELYDLPDETPMAEYPRDVLRSFREARVTDVRFAYNADKQVLNDVNLTIRAGDTIAIMGSSGCGKSTLFSLMLGVFAPDSGSFHVTFDSIESDGPVHGLFAYVPQGNALFSGTLRENIAMFSQRQVTEAEIWNAAEMACIDGFIRTLKDGMDSTIGEHGIGLSEGQAQRIAIARALLTDAPVLLLDEATSALDEETEARLLKNIGKLKNKTCLIVTHRRAALEICNRKVVVRDGILEEIK